MVDVDGVLVRGRPADGRAWASEIEADLGVSIGALHHAFFAPFWDDIVVGRGGLRERLAPALATIAPHLSCDDVIAYWFANDARLDGALLGDLASCRATGLHVGLVTNQEHLRARYLLDDLGLKENVDRLYYSAALGLRKPDPAFFE